MNNALIIYAIAVTMIGSVLGGIFLGDYVLKNPGLTVAKIEME